MIGMLIVSEEIVFMRMQVIRQNGMRLVFLDVSVVDLNLCVLIIY